MFLEFYRLRQQPFGVTPDPAYLYLTNTHREALTSLLGGIKEGRGFFALIAEPGMGKTTLLYELLDQLHDCARTIFLFQTQCDAREFFQYLLSELGVDPKGLDLVTMHNKLNELLFAEMVSGRRFVLVVDEAQNLDDSVLETVRLLSNFETSYAKMLQIVLAGQPQLSDKLAQPKLAQLKQRLSVQARLDPLSAAETANYIDHRLMVAGHTGAPLFTPDALAVIARLGNGTPRTINHLCYGALSAAHELRHETIHADVIDSVAIKLGFSSAPSVASPIEKTVSREPAVAAVAARASAAAAAAGASAAASAAVPTGQFPASAPALAPANRTAAPKSNLPAQEGSGTLTYQAPKRFRLPRWASRGMVLAGILVLAGIFLTAFVLRFTDSGRSSAARAVPQSSTLPSAEAAPSSTSPSSVASPANRLLNKTPETNGSSSSSSAYSADPEESGSEQIITVAVKPDQTLRDLSVLYAGRYDGDMLKQILALNPELKDPDHLEPGQLIRLPLPAGSFRKGKVFTPEE